MSHLPFLFFQIIGFMQGIFCFPIPMNIVIGKTLFKTDQSANVITFFLHKKSLNDGGPGQSKHVTEWQSVIHTSKIFLTL